MNQRFIVLALILGCFSFLPAQPASDQVSLESIWLRYEYYPNSPDQFRWMADDQFYSVLNAGRSIDRYDIETGEKVDEVLNFAKLSGSDLSPDAIESYEFGAGESKLLLKTESESIYRRSSREYCYVADRATAETLPIHEGQKITNAMLSPDGSKVAFVFENNLYYTDLGTEQEVQVTQDGSINSIINGLTDWVYEEEFAFVDAFKWSPDGKRIAFYRFDETAVKEFNLPLYGQLYPELYTFKYPKAGEANALVSIHIYELENRATTMVDIGTESDQYIPRMTWASSNNLALMRLNRLQNQLDVLLVDAKSGESRVYLTEISDTYIREATDDKWHFLASGDMIWLSEMNGYNHLYLYSNEGKVVRDLTEGEYEVAELVGIDEAQEMVYYLSTEDSPLERQLYSVNFKGKKKKKLTQQAGWHDITPSSAFSYFVDEFSSTTQVPISQLIDRDGKVLQVLEENKGLEQRLSKLAIQPSEFFSFTTTDGAELNGWMIKPTDFDPAKKYPVLMFCYGGPGSQEVLNGWGHNDPFNYMWYQMLAQQGYLIACVDNRGTGARGRDFRAVTYADLGKYETFDQIQAAKYLQEQSYVDADRIGIWGWSYGGYLSSLCMTKGRGLFKAGIAVAPVTNWRFYDTIYTERYLKTPQLNADGYDKNSPINFARNLQGSYLLVHGTGDDNVHFQNTVEWTDALISANKQFDLFFYPNRTHGIAGGITRFHLYTQMTNFLLENL